jgi:hypothetical protein
MTSRGAPLDKLAQPDIPWHASRHWEPSSPRRGCRSTGTLLNPATLRRSAVTPLIGLLDRTPCLQRAGPYSLNHCGDDGPFRLCATNNGDLPARHDMPTPADVVPAPAGWWTWWSNAA